MKDNVTRDNRKALPKVLLMIGAAALLGVFDSQIAGGKRYDLAAVGRRLANATFFASHDTDQCDSLSYGLDITQPVYGGQDMSAVMMEYIENFRAEIEDRIRRFS